MERSPPIDGYGQYPCSNFGQERKRYGTPSSSFSPAHPVVERKRTLRNSVLDLQQLYRAQLTTLWSTVEGSQKYLPLIPGRHLVFETHNFIELNPATYKAKQSVSLFLLSDLLLIAGRRRTKTAVADEKARGRMVAERCWVLADLVVIDVKDSGGGLKVHSI